MALDDDFLIPLLFVGGLSTSAGMGISKDIDISVDTGMIITLTLLPRFRNIMMCRKEQMMSLLPDLDECQ